MKELVYILTNECFKEDVIKIGLTSRTIEERINELDWTSTPLPFEPYAVMQTKKYSGVENIMHTMFDANRIRQNREFFNVHPEKALKNLISVAKVIDDATVYKYIDGQPIQVYPVDETIKESASKSKKFSFDMIGLTIGDKVVFEPLNLEVPISGSNTVCYDGEDWTLSRFCGKYMPADKQIPSRAYQGPKYFTYCGKSLVKIRQEKGI